MGCVQGKAISAEKPPSEAHTKTSRRIQEALTKKKAEFDKEKHQVTFEKILLKFEKLRSVISKIKEVYGEIAVEGSLNFEGLQRAMNSLHGHMEKDEIANLFEFVDLDSSKSIEFKEFLVALTVGHVLEIVPTFQGIKQSSQRGPDSLSEGPKDAAKDQEIDHATEAPSARTSAKTEEIHRMLNLIVSAYLLFDPNANGYIERESVEVLIGEGKRKNAMLSQQRWDEMDWDANGKIDFAEFVHAFSSWVDIEEDEE